jgi:hypothetical protein
MELNPDGVFSSNGPVSGTSGGWVGGWGGGVMGVFL